MIKVHGYSRFRDCIGIITDYMPGGSLETLMMNISDGRFIVPTIPHLVRMQFCYDICKGIAHLHHDFGNERIVHGDIKPANILLSSCLDCKVADFGGARIAVISDKISKNDPRPREKGNRHATGSYCAPERNPDVGLSKAMDVYSVGATIYAILLREDPYEISQELFEERLKARNCLKFALKEEFEYFEFLKKLMLNCCQHEPEKRICIIKAKDSLQKQMDHCNKAKLKQYIAGIKDVYKIAPPSSHFSSSKTLDSALLADFDAPIKDSYDE